jgi:rubrerythrin
MRPEKERLNLDQAADILDLAISAEMDAHQFYLRAADRTKDGKARAAFLALAVDEEGIASNWRESTLSSWETEDSNIVPEPISCIDI